LSCKAVYLETYATPLRINHFIVGELSRQMKKYNFSAWQLAQISGLDITLPQAALENGALRNALQEWEPGLRHKGVYVVPIEVLHSKLDINRHIRNAGRSEHRLLETFCNNYIIPSVGETKKSPQRLIDVADRLGIPQEAVFPCANNLRVERAHPITHLTLRLTHSDWWTWGNAPSNDPRRQLCLDPTFGQFLEGRPSNERMRFRASERLAGRHPRLGPQCWGSHISSSLPDLKTLELVLETWKVKEEQLESVMQCAKTWRFCEDGGEKEKERRALVWDGEVVEKRWSRGLRGLRSPKDANWSDRCKDFEVRVVRYVRKTVGG
jgi:hypothetical protein